MPGKTARLKNGVVLRRCATCGLSTKKGDRACALKQKQGEVEVETWEGRVKSTRQVVTEYHLLPFLSRGNRHRRKGKQNKREYKVVIHRREALRQSSTKERR